MGLRNSYRELKGLNYHDVTHGSEIYSLIKVANQGTQLLVSKRKFSVEGLTLTCSFVHLHRKAWHRLMGPKLGALKEFTPIIKSLHYHNVTHRFEKYSTNLSCKSGNAIMSVKMKVF